MSKMKSGSILIFSLAGPLPSLYVIIGAYPKRNRLFEENQKED